MADIVILGAGPTGLSAAYHLEQLGYYSYTLFEKESTVGGLCRSVSADGFTFDYTGHLLHFKDPYFKQFITSLIPLTELEHVIRRSYVYSQDTYTKYPYQINLHGLPSRTIADCLEGFIKRPASNKEPASFYSWVLRHFGAGFGKHFFFTYQEKIFSYPIKKITTSWIGRFIPSTSLEQLIEGAIGTHSEQVGYNAEFYYPRYGGINQWIEQLHTTLTNTVRTNHTVVEIDMRSRHVIFSNGHREPYRILITTIPLKAFIKQLKESPAYAFKTAEKKLLCNSVINFNLGINRSDLSDKHWIYYPETQYPFYRIGFPHNFSSALVPAGCSSLYGEFGFMNESQYEIEQKLAASLKAAYKLFDIAPHEILVNQHLTIPYAYVTYNRWREKYLTHLLAELKEHDIHSVGRYGAWKYSSMEEAVLDGKQIAQELVTPLYQHSVHTHMRSSV